VETLSGKALILNDPILDRSRRLLATEGLHKTSLMLTIKKHVLPTELRKGAQIMAKERTPNTAQKKKIVTKFNRILDGKVEFFEEKELKNWYGIFNDKAFNKLKATWEETHSSSGKIPDWTAPKLTVVRIDRPKGYALGLKDTQKDWTWKFGS
jgi:hypothetical protein